MPQQIKAHPIYMLQRIVKYLVILLIPLVRALLESKDRFSLWIEGVWLDILLVGGVVLFGVASFWCFQILVQSNALRVSQGVFLKKVQCLPLGALSVVIIERSWYLRLFGAVRFKVDTSGGSKKHTEISITLSKAKAEYLANYIKQYKTLEGYGKQALSETGGCFSPKNRGVVLFSFLTSNSITGVLFFYATVKKAGDVLGKDISELLFSRFSELAKLIDFGLPPLFGFIASLSLLFWSISFLQGLLRHMRFSSCRHQNVVEISAGILSRRHFFIDSKHVNVIYLRTSLLLSFFGLCSVFVHCAGYGKGESELSVLLPAGKKAVLQRQLRELLPNFVFANKMIGPKRVNFSKFIFTPSMVVAGILLVMGLLFYLFPSFSNVIILLFVALEIPAVWWLLVMLYSYYHSGVAISEHTITLYYTKGFQIIQSSIPKEKISRITISQSIYQKKTNCVHLNIFTAAEKKQHQCVKNLNRTEVEQLLF